MGEAEGGFIIMRKDIERREKLFTNKFNNANVGFKYESGYINSYSNIVVKCNQCGQLLERSSGFIRKVIRGERNISCDKCEGRVRTTQLRKSISKECGYCGKTFIAKTHSKIYCTDECLRKHRNQNKENMRTARYYKLFKDGSYDSTISLDLLVKRDNNICHICNGECNSNDHVVTRDGHFIVGRDYPSVDHVIPRSKGGTHIWGNVKLAHMKCNSEKSDKIIYKEGTGQLKMIAY